jgi:N-acetylmuramoyl-L-alanine amidase
MYISKVMKAILHCSDSFFGNAVMIDGWHAEKGFKNGDGIHIGYQLVILNGKINARSPYDPMLDGLLETGRAIGEAGAHTLGFNGSEYVGICLIGKSAQFTSAQLLKVTKVLSMLRQAHGTVTVTQHSDHDPVNRKYCAGLTAAQMKLFNSL